MAQAQKPSPAQLNAEFLTYSFSKPIAGLTQNNSYATSKTMYFTSPTLGGTWTDKIRVVTDLTFNYTPAASNPSFALNAAAPYNLYSQVQVLLGNNAQVTANPYLFKIMEDMRGYNRVGFDQVNQQNTTIQNELWSVPTIASGSNSWTVYFDIPLNAVHPSMVEGMLPLGAANSPVKVNLTTASSFTGSDPLENVVSTNGTISNVTGTTSVVFITRGPVTWHDTAPVMADLSGYSTVQTLSLEELNPLVSSQYAYKKFNVAYPVVKFVSLIIDGNQSNKFCAANNITGFDLDTDDNPANSLVKYDDTTGGFSQYYIEQRNRYGRDFDEGVFIFDTSVMNTVDASLRNGVNTLNLTTQNGWPTSRYGFKVSSVSSSNGINPRVVTYAIVYNNAGISVVQA